MEEIIVQWATILSPIIAVIIACWTGWSTSRDASKQIKTMQESTQKEVDSMKKLASLQVEILAMQMELEQIKSRLLAKQNAEEKAEISQILGINMTDFRNMAMSDFNAKKSERDQKYLEAYLQQLDKLSNKIYQIREEIKK